MLVFNERMKEWTNDLDLNSCFLLMGAFPSLSLRFLVCKIEITTLSLIERIQWYNKGQYLSQLENTKKGGEIEELPYFEVHRPFTLYDKEIYSLLPKSIFPFQNWKLFSAMYSKFTWPAKRNSEEITQIKCKVYRDCSPCLFPHPALSWQMSRLFSFLLYLQVSTYVNRRSQIR